MRLRFVLMAAVLALLAACTPSAAAPTAAPTSPPPTPTPTPAPTKTPEPTAPPPTATVTPAATPAPEATTAASAPQIQALYLCEGGLCRNHLGEQEPNRLITALNPSLHGYAFSPDGTQIVLAQESYPTGEVEIILTNLDLLDVRGIGTVSGVESGAGGLEGFGVVGLAADGAKVIFEDQAQLFVANLDGSERRAVMEQKLYGASSTHTYALSPTGARVLFTTTGNPNSFTIADTTAEGVREYALDRSQRALALIDDSHVLVERFEPPFDPEGSNPAGIVRFTLGYDIIAIEGDQLGSAMPLITEDGSMSRSVVSNVVGEWVLLRDDFLRNGEDVAQAPARLWLLNVKTGMRTPASLPGYSGANIVSLAVQQR